MDMCQAASTDKQYTKNHIYIIATTKMECVCAMKQSNILKGQLALIKIMTQTVK